MHGVEEEGVGVEGAGVEVATVAMVDMETTKVAIIRVVGIMTIKVDIMAMIIKVDIVAMIIKVGMVVDMAITKADMGTIKKMVDITEEEEVVCEEEAIGVTVEAMKEAGVVAMKEAGSAAAMKVAGVVVVLVEGDMVAEEGVEWVAADERTKCMQTSGVSFNACLINISGKIRAFYVGSSSVTCEVCCFFPWARGLVVSIMHMQVLSCKSSFNFPAAEVVFHFFP